MREYGIAESYHESVLISSIEEEFENDFNTANAISLYFKYMSDEIGDEEKQNVQTFMCFVLGLIDENDSSEIPTEVLQLIEERSAAKKARDFGLADAIREKIGSLGYEIEDTREGVKCHKK